MIMILLEDTMIIIIMFSQEEMYLSVLVMVSIHLQILFYIGMDLKKETNCVML